MTADPHHAAGLALFRRLKRFSQGIFDGKTLEISEYYGRVDLRIEFDDNFVPTIVDGDLGDLEEDEDAEGDAGEQDGSQEISNSIASEGEDHLGEVSFESGPLDVAETTEIVETLPLFNTTLRRLPDDFKLDGADSRSRNHIRNKSGIATKKLVGGGAESKVNHYTFILLFRLLLDAHPPPSQRFPSSSAKVSFKSEKISKVVDSTDAEATAASLPPSLLGIRSGSDAMMELHDRVQVVPDTSMCHLCRKFFSPPSLKEGHECNTNRKCHVDLGTFGLLCAVHCIQSGETHVVERGVEEEATSAKKAMKRVREVFITPTSFPPCRVSIFSLSCRLVPLTSFSFFFLTGFTP
jgi:hypothetical protein